MMMLEDLRLTLRQICRAMGLPGDAATLVSLIVLGVALNLTALRAVEYVGIGRHSCHGRTALQSAAQTELKVMRTVVVSTLKKMSDGGRRWCLAREWMMGKQTRGMGYHVEVGRDLAAPTSGEGCDGRVVSRSRRKMALGFVQC
jgi:hypothetical protein